MTSYVMRRWAKSLGVGKALLFHLGTKYILWRELAENNISAQSKESKVDHLLNTIGTL